MNQRSGLANFVLAFSPFLLMAPITICAWLESRHHGAGTLFAFIVMLLGLGSFSAAKGSRFSAGRWFSLGTGGMAPWARLSYLGGYACMTFGLIGLLFIELALR